jgi:hypothetical protein
VALPPTELKLTQQTFNEVPVVLRYVALPPTELKLTQQTFNEVPVVLR